MTQLLSIKLFYSSQTGAWATLRWTVYTGEPVQDTPGRHHRTACVKATHGIREVSGKGTKNIAVRIREIVIVRTAVLELEYVMSHRPSLSMRKQ